MRFKDHEIRAFHKMHLCRQLHYFCFFLAIPAAIVAPALSFKLRWWWAWFFLAAPLFGFAYTYIWLKHFKCPRCSQSYFPQDGPLPNMDTAVPPQRRCQGCGLEKG